MGIVYLNLTPAILSLPIVLVASREKLLCSAGHLGYRTTVYFRYSYASSTPEAVSCLGVFARNRYDSGVKGKCCETVFIGSWVTSLMREQNFVGFLV